MTVTQANAFEARPKGLLSARFRGVRAETERRAALLSPEDQQVQSMPDCSPAKWHRAHATWFFETFLLIGLAGQKPFDPAFGYLFNSYYEAVGARHPRPLRGVLTRPSAEEVTLYRADVDRRMQALIEGGGLSNQMLDLVELGLNHEQQHQELLLTDIKHAFWSNPTHPSYGRGERRASFRPEDGGWVDLPSGIYEAGAPETGFAFDNERPRHRIYLQRCRVATQPITCGEYLEFIAAGGYRRPEFWFSDGWDAVRSGGWDAPLYWFETESGRRRFTLSGDQAIDDAEPVQHVSFYEAAAYAAWAGRRLPTEFEWEAAIQQDPKGQPSGVWEWTSSAYLPYPGYRTAAGAVGEYNGKFMSGQMVLRGGSWATPDGHARPTYRNFFPPAARWQVSGFRLAEDQ